jgi:DedD protein
MGMRYTSDLGMNDRSLRDVERWKDKIEVRLDNRQVFFLFFGSALVACLLFILGVIVGKRLESRGKAVAPEMEDPLALLDKVAAAPLVASEPSAAAVAPPTPVAAPTPTPVPTPKPTVAAPKPAPVAALKPTPVAAPKPTPAAPIADEPAEPAAASPPAAAAAVTTAAAKGHGRFTLQLGSFPDRGEAETFAKQFGDQTYVVPSEIPGRGLWYRVRAGDYGSVKDAIAAKASFEKQHNVIAYVVGPTPAR